MKTLEQRFEDHVLKTCSCWIWQGAANPAGYGHVSFEGKFRQATHVSWFLVHGHWPQLQILHHCDTPRCVNPAHLYEGTQQENLDDRRRRGRYRGERNYNARFTEDQIRLIRERLRKGGVTQQKLADEFGVTQYAIWAINSGRTWSHVQP